MISGCSTCPSLSPRGSGSADPPRAWSRTRASSEVVGTNHTPLPDAGGASWLLSSRWPLFISTVRFAAVEKSGSSLSLFSRQPVPGTVRCLRSGCALRPGPATWQAAGPHSGVGVLGGGPRGQVTSAWLSSVGRLPFWPAAGCEGLARSLGRGWAMRRRWRGGCSGRRRRRRRFGGVRRGLGRSGRWLRRWRLRRVRSGRHGFW